MAAIKLSSETAWRTLLSSIETILFDCDGVLWVGNADRIHRAPEALSYVRKLGKKICFVTNNSSKSRDEYLKKFDNLGFEAYKTEIFPSGYVAGQYLKHTAGYSGKVYLIGVEGTKQEIEDTGCTCFGPGPDVVKGTLSDWLQQPFENDVGAVVVGYDYHISYMKILKACTYLKNPNCHFIATNEDSNLPSGGPVAIPGTGANVAAVKTAAKREPVVVGKPHTPILDCISRSISFDPSKTLMIGDTLATDILFGKKHGLKTLLVLTGNTKEEELHDLSKELSPDYYTQSIADLLCLS